MKTIYTLAAIATFAFAQAQKKTEISQFGNLAVSGNISLTFVKASAGSIEVTKGKADNLKIATSGENTALSLVNGNEAVAATVYYTGEIHNIAVGGGAEISAKDAFTGPEFGLAVSSGSKASINAKVETLQVAAASGSNVTVTGTANKVEAAVASGAFFDAKKSEAVDVQIVVASGAKALINATGTVDVNVASNGELTIYGKPQEVNEVKTADSIIKRA
jgi:Putative auto-transporter adhesin, head GIN domain